MNLQRRRTSVGAHYKVRFYILRSIYNAKDIFTAGNLLNDLVMNSIPTEPHLLFELSKVASMMSTVFSNANLRLVHKVYAIDPHIDDINDVDIRAWINSGTLEYRFSLPSRFTEAANEGWLLSYDETVRHYGMARYKYSKVRRQLNAQIEAIYEAWSALNDSEESAHPAENWTASLSGFPMHFAYLGAPVQMLFDGYDWEVYYNGEYLKDVNVRSISEANAFVEDFVKGYL